MVVPAEAAAGVMVTSASPLVASSVSGLPAIVAAPAGVTLTFTVGAEVMACPAASFRRKRSAVCAFGGSVVVLLLPPMLTSCTWLGVGCWVQVSLLPSTVPLGHSQASPAALATLSPLQETQSSPVLLRIFLGSGQVQAPLTSTPSVQVAGAGVTQVSVPVPSSTVPLGHSQAFPAAVGTLLPGQVLAPAPAATSRVKGKVLPLRRSVSSREMVFSPASGTIPTSKEPLAMMTLMVSPPPAKVALVVSSDLPLLPVIFSRPGRLPSRGWPPEVRLMVTLLAAPGVSAMVELLALMLAMSALSGAPACASAAGGRVVWLPPSPQAVRVSAAVRTMASRPSGDFMAGSFQGVHGGGCPLERGVCDGADYTGAGGFFALAGGQKKARQRAFSAAYLNQVRCVAGF